MIAAALAVALAVAQADDPYADGPEGEDEHPARVLVSAWGGSAFTTGADSGSAPLLGGEVAWAFDTVDVGVAGYGYRKLPDATREWTPVAMLRLTQRFDTGRGFEAAFTVGLGAGRPDRWEAWYLIALGVRAGAGPLFIAGELGLEQLNQLRLAAGVGVRF